jgi:hypothetical protein
MADAKAKQGAQLEGHGLTIEESRSYHVNLKKLEQVARAFATMLDVFPESHVMYGNLTKVGPSARAEAPPKVVSNHDYYWTGGAWRCRRCLLQAQAKSHEGKHGQCPGFSSTLKRVIQEGAGNGHTLSVASDQKADSNINVSGTMAIYCSNCGKYTDRVAREILDPCKHRKNTGSASCLRQIESGQHPTKRHNTGPPSKD